VEDGIFDSILDEGKICSEAEEISFQEREKM
jgi:hypothetical protein